MSNKTTANWLLIFVTTVLSATGIVMLVLKSAATFWFQSMGHSSQVFLG